MRIIQISKTLRERKMLYWTDFNAMNEEPMDGVMGSMVSMLSVEFDMRLTPRYTEHCAAGRSSRRRKPLC
ncbi:MAG: hypothetical protein P8Y12_05555 [Gammaproteobacteria bacterium]